MRTRGGLPITGFAPRQGGGRLGDISDQLVSIEAALIRIEGLLAQSAELAALDRRKKRNARWRQQALTLAFLIATLLLIGLAYDRGMDVRAASRPTPGEAGGHLIRDI